MRQSIFRTHCDSTELPPARSENPVYKLRFSYIIDKPSQECIMPVLRHLQNLLHWLTANNQLCRQIDTKKRLFNSDLEYQMAGLV